MRKIVGVIFLLIFVGIFVSLFIFKEELKNMGIRHFIAPILAFLFFAGCELIWPSKKKIQKDD